MIRGKKLSGFVTLLMVAAIVLIGCAGKSVPAPTDAVSSSTPEAPVGETASNAVEQSSGDSRTLIVYYSYTGTTQRVAERLQALTGGTLYLLELADPYTGGSYDVSDRVFAERDDGKMPELTGALPDISEYDRILIGTPVWNDSMSNPVLSYLEQTDFGGKVMAPFWTYITNQGSTAKDFAANIQNGIAAKGLALRSVGGMSGESLDDTLRSWLDKLPEGK